MKKINIAQLIQNILFLGILVLSIVFLLRGLLLNREETHPVRELDSGWQITRNDVPVSGDTLSHIRTGNVAYGETFTLTRTLGDGDDLPSACLYFRNLHTAVRVFLDGEVFYTSGTEAYEAGKMVGRRICFAPVPKDYAGKTLTIELTASENNSFYGLGPVLFGTEQDLFIRFLNERQFAFFIAIFLCIFGTIQLFWLPFLLMSDRANIKLLYTALTTLVLGVYLMGYYNLFDLFTDIVNVNTMLEYIAFYSVACTMSGYITTVTTGKMQKMYRAFVCFDLAFIAFALVMHFLNVIHFTSFIIANYVISFCEASPFMIMLLSGWHRHRKTYFDRMEELADRALAVGFFSYVLGAVIDAVIFSVVRFTGGQEATVTIPCVTIASLVFSTMTSLHYFLHGVVNLRKEATRRHLMDKAYSDALTGLSNRGECEMILDRLSKEHKRFTIISMDMDNLKHVNDTLGHAEGDRMLSGFAEILGACFAGCELIGRMGGDEFIVILTGDDCDRAEELITHMNKLIAIRNLEEESFQYSVSWGIAKNGDGRLGRRAHDVYMLADARMYDMKRRRK